MTMIRAEHLTFAYPGSPHNVFEDCSFQIDTDWRLGFVGRNGRGKTTFLKLLMKEYEYRGRITGNVPFAYFPCPVPEPEREALEILREICPTAQDWEFLRELSYLETEPDILWRSFSTLSGGERTKALLTAFFLKEGYFPLIDEPTNHLDTRGRAVLANYLRRKKGFILVSHDRTFLDGCVDHILSLNRSGIDVQSGNFSMWAENFQRKQHFEEAQNAKLKKEIRRLQEAAGQTSAWSARTEASKFGTKPADRGYIGHKAAKMMKRAKTIEARKLRAAEETSGLLKNTETAEDLKLCPLPHHSRILVSLDQVSVSCGSKPIFGPLSFQLGQGDRIALDGCGKSSVLKLIVHEVLLQNDTPASHAPACAPCFTYTGKLSVAPGLTVSYVPQDTSFLRGTLETFARERNIDGTLLRTVLRKLDFDRLQFEKPLEALSEGQKKKALLAGSLCQRAHLYIWDEPLNYIDLYSRMQIEELVRRFQPTMLFVEHDRAFRDHAATRIVSLVRDAD